MTTAILNQDLARKQNLRIAEAATVLGLGKSKVYELIASGRLRSVKIDGARRIPSAAIDEFMARFNATGEIGE